MTTRDNTQPAALALAIANLLRLANTDVQDAELLSAGRHPENAPLLLHWAVRRLLEAIIATERGWPVPFNLIDFDKIPDENPLKLALARFIKFARPPKPLTLRPDGSIPDGFDQNSFRQDVSAVRKLLLDMAERLEVNLLGNGPAECAVAARPPAVASKPQPARLKQETTPTSASQKDAASTKLEVPSPPRNEKRSPPVLVRDTRPKKPNVTASSTTEGRSPISISPGGTSMTSSAFWGLMDRWQIADVAALDLLGHQGGLSKKGTRPRFKLQGKEAKMASLLFELDQAIGNLGLDPETWVGTLIKAAPFRGATPAAYLTQNGAAGAQEVSRYLLKNGLKLSMSGTS